MIETAAAFLGISSLVIVTPGQDTVLTIRNPIGGIRGDARRRETSVAVRVAPGKARRLTRAVALRQALLSDLGNPKMAVFCAMTLAWLSVYAFVVGVAGVVLVALGVRLASQQR